MFAAENFSTFLVHLKREKSVFERCSPKNIVPRVAKLRDVDRENVRAKNVLGCTFSFQLGSKFIDLVS